MSDIRWDVLAPKGVFSATPGRVIGQVTAPDRRTAQQRARFHYGPDVGVIAAITRRSERREKLGPGVLPARERKPAKSKEQLRAFCAMKRRQAKAAPHDPELSLGAHDAPRRRAETMTKPNSKRLD